MNGYLLCNNAYVFILLTIMSTNAIHKGPGDKKFLY